MLRSETEQLKRINCEMARYIEWFEYCHQTLVDLVRFTQRNAAQLKDKLAISASEVMRQNRYISELASRNNHLEIELSVLRQCSQQAMRKAQHHASSGQTPSEQTLDQHQSSNPESKVDENIRAAAKQTILSGGDIRGNMVRARTNHSKRVYVEEIQRNECEFAVNETSKHGYEERSDGLIEKECTANLGSFTMGSGTDPILSLYRSYFSAPGLPFDEKPKPLLTAVELPYLRRLFF